MELADRLEDRAYRFAVRVLRFCPRLPSTPEGYTIRSQLLRAAQGTVGNYRAARRARSRREFVSFLGKTAEEADETSLWTRLIVDGGICNSDEAGALCEEAAELMRIFGKSYATARDNQREVQLRRTGVRQPAKAATVEDSGQRTAASSSPQAVKASDRQLAKSPDRQIASSDRQLAKSPTRQIAK
jgi:four helix bundle protein